MFRTDTVPVIRFFRLYTLCTMKKLLAMDRETVRNMYSVNASINLIN